MTQHKSCILQSSWTTSDWVSALTVCAGNTQQSAGLSGRRTFHIACSDSTFCACYHRCDTAESALLGILMVQACSSSDVDPRSCLHSTASLSASISPDGRCSDTERRVELSIISFACTAIHNHGTRVSVAGLMRFLDT